MDTDAAGTSEARIDGAREMLARARAQRAFSIEHLSQAKERRLLAYAAAVRAATAMRANLGAIARAGALSPALSSDADHLLDKVQAIWLTLASSRKLADTETAKVIDRAMEGLDFVAELLRRTPPWERPDWTDDIQEIDDFASGIYRNVHD